MKWEDHIKNILNRALAAPEDTTAEKVFEQIMGYMPEEEKTKRTTAKSAPAE